MRDLEEEEEIRASRRWLDRCKVMTSCLFLRTFSLAAATASPTAHLHLPLSLWLTSLSVSPLLVS